MANIFVRSTTGNDSNDGLSWATAKATLAGADAIDAPSDTIFISKDHTETITGDVLYKLGGDTWTYTTKLITCVDDTGNPANPTVLADTAKITCTGEMTFDSQMALIHGLQLTAGAHLVLGAASSFVDVRNCRLLAGTGTVRLKGARASLRDCQFGNTGYPNLVLACWGYNHHITGCTVINPAGVQWTYLITTWTGGNTYITDCDLSAMPPFTYIQDEFYNQSPGILRVAHCKLPTNWVGGLSAFGWAGAHPDADSQMHNCDSLDTNYRLATHCRAGQVFSETTVVRTGGASNGSTPLAWKMVTTGSAKRQSVHLLTPGISIWNEITGSSVTLTIETLTNNVTLTSADFWLEYSFSGNSGVPLGTFVTTEAPILSTGMALASSSAAWTTIGMPTPVKQKITITFTPQEKGFVQLVAKLARPDTTVYVCPKLA